MRGFVASLAILVVSSITCFAGPPNKTSSEIPVSSINCLPMEARDRILYYYRRLLWRPLNWAVNLILGHRSLERMKV